LVQYLGNMADEAFCWTCCPRHIGATSLNCEDWDHPCQGKLVVCAVLLDPETQHLPGVEQWPRTSMYYSTMHSLLTNPQPVVLLWARILSECVFPCHFLWEPFRGIFVT
jgi:hypothetical protein